MIFIVFDNSIAPPFDCHHLIGQYIKGTHFNRNHYIQPTFLINQIKADIIYFPRGTAGSDLFENWIKHEKLEVFNFFFVNGGTQNFLIG